MTITLKLTRAARRSGGDKFEVKLPHEEKPWLVYFPQSISRKGGVQLEEITIEIK